MQKFLYPFACIFLLLAVIYLLFRPAPRVLVPITTHTETLVPGTEHADTHHVKVTARVKAKTKPDTSASPSIPARAADPIIIDTSFVKDGVIVSIYSTDVVAKGLDVFVDVPVVKKSRIDTLFVRDSVSVPLDLKWYETRTFGFICGVAVTAGTVFLVK